MTPDRYSLIDTILKKIPDYNENISEENNMDPKIQNPLSESEKSGQRFSLRTVPTLLDIMYSQVPFGAFKSDKPDFGSPSALSRIGGQDPLSERSMAENDQFYKNLLEKYSGNDTSVSQPGSMTSIQALMQSMSPSMGGYNAGMAALNKKEEASTAMNRLAGESYNKTDTDYKTLTDEGIGQPTRKDEQGNIISKATPGSISESTEKFQQDAKELQNFKFQSRADIMNRMSGTDKIVNALGGFMGGMAQGLLKQNSNQYLDQMNKMVDSEVDKNHNEWQNLQNTVLNDQKLTENQRNLLSLRADTMFKSNQAQLQATLYSYDEILKGSPINELTKAGIMADKANLMMKKDAMINERNMFVAKTLYNPDNFVPNAGRFLTKEKADKFRPIQEKYDNVVRNVSNVLKNTQQTGHNMTYEEIRNLNEASWNSAMNDFAELMHIDPKQSEKYFPPLDSKIIGNKDYSRKIATGILDLAKKTRDSQEININGVKAQR